MPILKVTCKGQEIAQQTLSDQQEIWIGRDSQNDIVLESSHGISRKHLKVFQTSDQEWKVKCTSNIGGLISESQEVDEIVLKDQTIFFLQDFSFQFLLHSNEKEDSSDDLLTSEKSIFNTEKTAQNQFKVDDKPSKKDKNRDSSQEVATGQSPFKDEDHHSQKEKSASIDSSQGSATQSSFGDKTAVSLNRSLQAQIVISFSDEDIDEKTVVLKDQSSWIIGRDLKCDVCIEDRGMSREHLKIEKKNEEYFITDLKSSNGTLLNNERLNAQQPHSLKSGDVLRILDIKIYFDIVNLSLKDKDLPLPVPSSSNNEFPQDLPPLPNAVMDETKLTAMNHLSSHRKKRTFLIAGILALIFTGVYFSNKNQEQEIQTNASGDTLSPEDQEKIRDMYTIAQQLFQMKKFELCIDKIEELHIITTTEQSLELQKKCVNGKDSLISQQEIERKKEEQERINALISQNIEECEKKFPTFRSVEEIQNCFAPTLDYDPENFTVIDLISQFEIQELERQERKELQKNLENKIQKEMDIYNKALALKTSGQVLKAIEAYKNFLKRKHPQQISQTVQKAQQELEDMQRELDEKISIFMNECESLLTQQKYKEAHQACQKTLSVLPRHPPALDGMQTAIDEINKKLKPIYEESVLNESLGRVDNAKKFWNEIIEKDIPNGEYAKKSQSKLDKY